MSRKSPIRHPVSGYNRKSGHVSPHERGRGSRPQRQSRVVGQVKPDIKGVLTFPVHADVVDTQIRGYDYDYKESVKRPVIFLMTILTDDNPRGHEDEEWVKGALPIFSNLDNTLREGYVVDNVAVIENTLDRRRNSWTIKIYLKRGGREIETKMHEEAYMEDIAEATLPVHVDTPTQIPPEMNGIISDEPPRILNFGTERVFVSGDMETDQRQGLDLWIEIHRFEPKLLEGQDINYNTAGTITSKSFDYLRSHRKDHEFIHDIYKAYRAASRGLQLYDAEEVAIALSAFKAEIERINKDKWRVEGSIAVLAKGKKDE